MNDKPFPSQETSEPTAKFDREVLVRGWREYEHSIPRCLPLLKFAARTDMGQVRENNEDKFDFYEPEEPSILAARGCFYAVADGMGGALAGQIASELTLKRILTTYYDHPAADPQAALREAILEANDYIYALAQAIPERSGMGTTLVAALFIEDQVVIAHVGDSRAYLLREGSLRQVTVDHSWVEEQVRAGVLTREEAELSPFRNVITRSIGATPNVLPDFYEEKCQEGDTWLLCSDGLTGHVEDSEIASILERHAPSEAARQLVELANARGGRDNITVFVLSVRAVVPYEEAASFFAPQNAKVSMGNSPSPQGASSASSPGDSPSSTDKKPLWRRFLLGR